MQKIENKTVYVDVLLSIYFYRHRRTLTYFGRHFPPASFLFFFFVVFSRLLLMLLLILVRYSNLSKDMVVEGGGGWHFRGSEMGWWGWGGDGWGCVSCKGGQHL